MIIILIIMTVVVVISRKTSEAKRAAHVHEKYDMGEETV